LPHAELALDPTASTGTMRAATLAAARESRVETVAAPDPGPREVLVRLEGSGVCASSLPVWEGRPWFDYPLAPGEPGHEGWGVVVAAGDGVAEPEVGTRVAVLSQRAFAELDVAAVDAVVPLPPELDGRPFPGEAIGCAVNAFRRSRLEPGQRVAVVGCGFLGLLLVQLAVRAGADVTAISRRAFALELARDAGAARTFALDEAPDEGFDCVVEAAGVQATLDVATRLTGVRGLLVIAGYHQDGPRQVDLQLWNWRGIDVVNAHERDAAAYVRGMREAARLVSDGALDPEPLYTHRLPLERTGDAFELLRTRPDGFLKALVLT
jgi:2-desacetyl-2-hydroxyethyl bacteriochlorophyllide A dehydrogenase